MADELIVTDSGSGAPAAGSTAVATPSSGSPSAPAGQPGASPTGGGGGSGAPAEPTLADVLKQIQSIQPHIGRITALQSKFDQMPAQFEAMFQKRFQDQQNQLALNQLAPEQRQQYEQQLLQRQQEEQLLKDLIRNGIKELLPTEYSGMVEGYQKLQDREQADNFFGAIEEVLGKEDAVKIAPYIGQMLELHRQMLESGDPTQIKEATKWMEKALLAPESVALRAIRMAQEDGAAGNAQVEQTRVAQQKRFGAVPTGAARASGVRNLSKMSAKEAEELALSMPTEEYEKLVMQDRKARGVNL